MNYVRIFKNITNTVCSKNIRSLSSINDIKYRNPYDAINKFLEKPFFKTIFNPSIEQQQQIQHFFNPRIVHNDKKIATVYDGKQIPAAKLPEVIFLGKSNVGKSSLLHSLLNNSQNVVVKVSARPGFTKSLNFFNIGKFFCLVDAPGYGVNEPKYLTDLLTKYFKRRDDDILKCVFLLLEAETELSDLDREMLEFLEVQQVRYALILTKIDRHGPVDLYKKLINIKEFLDFAKLNYCYPQVFLSSSTTGEGIGIIQALIARITDADATR